MFKGNGGVQEHSHALKKLEAGSGALSDQLSWQIGKAIKMVWTWTNLLHMETTWKPMLQNLSFDELDVFLTDLSLMTLQSCSAHHLRGAVLHDNYTYFKAHRTEGHKRGWYWFQMSYLHNLLHGLIHFKFLRLLFLANPPSFQKADMVFLVK